MGRYTWLLDSGHGGIIDGKYQTSEYWWKRAYFKDKKLLNPKEYSVEWLEANCDLKIYEGEVTRDIVKKLQYLCKKHELKCVDIVDSEKDISLQTRAERANKYRQSDNPILLSIHHNAFTSQDANGFEVYTTPGFTNSDIAATYFFNEIDTEFPDHAARSNYTDGDPDKEALFYIIKYTWMPAILTESLFYTNYEEALILSTDEGRQRIAEAHFKSIMKIEKNKPF
jgi:N-acetylmuramoyl-L-alanine amidase